MFNEKFWVTAPVKGAIPDYKNYLLPEYIRKVVNESGWSEAIAFESEETGRKLTFNQVLKNSQAFAAGLIQLQQEINSERTDVVAVILPNIPEYVSIVFGIWEAGLVANLVNPLYTKDEIKHQLQDSKSKAIITSTQLLPILREIQNENACIKKIIIVDTVEAETETDPDCLSYFKLLETETAGVHFFTGSQLTESNDEALLLYSSGTTGLPKGAILKHSALIAQTVLSSHPELTRTKRFGGENAQERLIAVAPFFHIFGTLCNGFMSMYQGVHVLTMSAFKPAIFAEKLRQHKPTIMYLVPTLVSFLSNSELIGLEELEHVHTMYCGAAPAGAALVQGIKNKAPNALFVNLYGLTEISGVGTFPRFQKPGSIGQPLPETTMKVVDVEHGKDLGQGEKGEICIRTPTIMKGYLNNERATRECIDEDGWLHTGDIGYFDEDGFFFIVDRIKELIKVKGFQVAPAELEDVIRSHEGVADVGVIGVPDEVMGEVPRAYVVPRVGQELSEEEIVGFVESKVTSYKRLKGGVQIISSIPKGGSGKILRRVLKANYLAQVS